MNDLFLKAKHWQLFVLTFVLPLLIQFYFMWTMLFTMIRMDFHSQPPDPFAMMDNFKYLWFIMILFNGILLAWQWSVAIGLQTKVPPTVKMKVNIFKIFFFIPVVYFSLFVLFISWMMSQMGIMFNENSTPPNFPVFIGVFILIIPLHLFSAFCLLYCIYFVAKTFKTVELQREVSFSDFIAEFFLVWFFPVGVWLLQPKINKFIEHQSVN